MAEQAEQPRCILVVDGDVLVRHAISDYLRSCGYTVIEASSTDEAGTVLSDDSVPVDAVLCDAEAPGGRNAFQLRAWTREHRQDVQIALAGSIEAAATKAAEFCEQGPHLTRPYDPQSVVDYVRRLLGGAS
ncbi:DNA-binding transcriptional response regulator [Allosphingosinicella deserti]|uniref:Response regulator n=1 Tax=Allosphingosinicella deserti TaxID=2116704 RepID=A0A2P7QPV2_9SPHN|nr:response regulator [Sphingomonas deserti]PSJ39978.1 response regulator [Sphingomonas deserti]